MNCSRCAAELPDSSTFCPRCGAASIPSGPLTTSSFSYLPAGTPPWPTSMPAKPNYASSSAMPAQMESSRLAQKPRRSLSNIIMTSVLILLIPCIGIGATLGILTAQGLFPPSAAASSKTVAPRVVPTPTAAAATTQGNQLPAPTSFKATSNKDLNVSLEYPSDWVQDTPSTGSDGTISLAIHPPQTVQANILFYIIHYSSATSTQITSADAVNQAQVSGFSQTSTVTNVQTVPTTNAPSSVGGTNWTPEQITFADSKTGNVKTDLMIMSALHNKLYYSLVVISPDMYYSEAVQKYIQHMYSTFQFLS